MFQTVMNIIARVIAVTLMLGALTSVAKAETQLLIGDVAIRATTGGMTATGGYVTIMNHGAAEDRLIGVSANFAKKSEIHMMEHVDGVMKMRAMPNGAPIPAGGMLVLKPGGMHLMFMGVDGALAPDSMKSITLYFEVAGKMTVTAHVKKPGDLRAMMDAAHEGHSDNDHNEKNDH